MQQARQALTPALFWHAATCITTLMLNDLFGRRSKALRRTARVCWLGKPPSGRRAEHHWAGIHRKRRGRGGLVPHVPRVQVRFFCPSTPSLL